MKLSEFNVSDLDFQRMGSWPTPVKAVFAAIIFIIIVGAGWWFYVQPKRESLRQHEAKETELLDQFRYKQGKVVNLPELKRQLEEMKELLRQMLRQLPSKTDMEDLLVDVSQTALSTGIDQQKFEPGAEVIKEFYAEKPINLRMVGTYHQFGSFISGVASLPRVVILTFHDISLRPQSASSGARNAAAPIANGELVLEGTVKTYRYVDEEEAAEIAAANVPAQAPGAKPAPGAPPAAAPPKGGL
jgi:type IV pilus assembly protein PilO